METYEEKLAQLKLIINSVYGSSDGLDMRLYDSYEEASILKKKILRIECRKYKIRNILISVYEKVRK